MPRPRHNRHIRQMPPCPCFKPAGMPARDIDEVLLTVDEYEAIRLADLEGLYQEEVSRQMGVSRQTVGRILQSAHGKVAEALVNGKALRIEGGTYVTEPLRQFMCRSCSVTWGMPYGGGPPTGCPECGSEDICRTDCQGGRGGRRRRRGRGEPAG